jgi:DNA-binding transcriptional LysR family regulator
MANGDGARLAVFSNAIATVPDPKLEGELPNFFDTHNEAVMAKEIDWEGRIGRRLRLRDLHVFFTAVQRGSMAKAAQTLGVSQPAVSKVIAELEHTLGVRLLDRGALGVEPTKYGRALLMRANAAFDELRQSVRDIEFLADPTVGEVRIGCQETFAAAVLPSAIHRFSQAYPRVVLHVEQLGSLAAESSALRDRTIDMGMFLLVKPHDEKLFADDLNVEVLFLEQMVIVAGRQSPWARRRKIDLGELGDQPWVVTESDTLSYQRLKDAFAARGLGMPRRILQTLSSHLRVNLAASGSHITTLPNSTLRVYGDRFAIKALPVDFPAQAWPAVVVTLKNRTLSPVVERFIEYIRDFTRPMRAENLVTRR